MSTTMPQGDDDSACSGPLPLFDLLAQMPHEPARSQRQIDGVLRLLSGRARRVLDLGCGSGRVLIPLARDGHYVTGIDRDADMLHKCRTQIGDAAPRVDLLLGDVRTAPWSGISEGEPQQPHAGSLAERFDAVLMLGNTLMTIHDLDEAITLFERVAAALVPGGWFVLDDLPHEFWPELTEGNWQSGLSEDGTMQIIWHSAEPVFTVRTGGRVNPERWEFSDDDELLRLWTSDLLRLAARVAGLSEPTHDAGGGLIVIRPKSC